MEAVMEREEARKREVEQLRQDKEALEARVAQLEEIIEEEGLIAAPRRLDDPDVEVTADGDIILNSPPDHCLLHGLNVDLRPTGDHMTREARLAQIWGATREWNAKLLRKEFEESDTYEAGLQEIANRYYFERTGRWPDEG